MVDRIEAEPIEGLAAERTGAGPPPPHASLVAGRERRRGAWRFPSTGVSVRGVRQDLRPFLAQAGLPDRDIDDLVLATCEAAANAIEHALQPTEFFFDVRAVIEGPDVVIVIRDYGRWRTGLSTRGNRGRGLHMMTMLATVTLTSGPRGTTVTLRHRRS
ncbi:ATP-binding protein [Blastococcus sp. CT_GayMR16]|uniref:ATP-binding protein n=1 Tax=Blastococcus sp. CT_GayMR16 TaxID=2559607 RepID=UPI001431ED69|nr:ATP-binding protein [Blastococcus sp. CT_GayMR16]